MSKETIEELIKQNGAYMNFEGYRLVPVWQNISSEVRDLIYDFWKRNRTIPSDPEERANQVVFLAIGPENNVVGVNSAYIDDVQNAGLEDIPSQRYYFYRMFTQKSDRKMSVTRNMLVSAYEYLKAFPEEDKPEGMILIAENPKLAHPAVQRGFHDIGWDPCGTDSRGLLVMRQDF